MASKWKKKKKHLHDLRELQKMSQNQCSKKSIYGKSEKTG